MLAAAGRGIYDRCAFSAECGSGAELSVANGGSFTDSGRGVLRPLVLAAAGMARFHRGNGGRRALAMAGGDSIGAGILGCTTLRLGLRMDRARHASPGCSAATPGRSWFLPLRAEPHVRGLRRRMDRAVGNFWASR